MPFRLFLGTLSRFPTLSMNIPNQRERIGILKTAQAEIISFVAEQCFLQVLTRNIPPVSDQKHRDGSKVLVYSETKKECLGFSDAIHVEYWMITIQYESETFEN